MRPFPVVFILTLLKGLGKSYITHTKRGVFLENTIKRIIEIENDAHALVDEGRREKEKIGQEALSQCRSMEDHILEMAENKIRKLEAVNLREAEDKIIRIYEDTALKMRLMEENAEENQKRWEDEIFNLVIGR